MKLRLILFLLILICFTNFANAQKKKNANLLDNLLTFEKIPDISVPEYSSSIISELISYKDAFFYSQQLEMGLYEIEIQDNYTLLKILNAGTSNQSKSTYLDIIIIRIAEENKDKKSGIKKGFYIENFKKYINLNRLSEVTNNTIKECYKFDRSAFPQVNINWKNKILWDKDILMNVVPSGPTRILNRERTRTFLRQYSNQNEGASLFCDLTDGVLIPENNGSSGKLFIVDKLWDRIIYANKNFHPII